MVQQLTEKDKELIKRKEESKPRFNPDLNYRATCPLDTEHERLETTTHRFILDTEDRKVSGAIYFKHSVVIPRVLILEFKIKEGCYVLSDIGTQKEPSPDQDEEKKG